MTLKVCLECDRELYGRSDKKFCSDQCRNMHNNKVRTKEYFHVRKVNRILLRNRNILMKFYTDSAQKINRRTLQESGYNFCYCTSIQKSLNDEVYYYCYEFGYKNHDKRFLTIVHKENELAN